MKKFNFRLEALLKLRRQIEDERRRELAEARRKTQQQLRHRRDIDDRSRATVEYKREHQSGVMSVLQLQASSRYMLRLRRDGLAADELLRALRTTEGKKREDLVKAARDRKVYEKLKEQRRDRHYREAAHLESKDADETGLNTYRLNRREEKRRQQRSGSM